MSITAEAVLETEPRSAVVVPSDWREHTTVPVPVGGAILGVGRNTSYAAAKTGELPTIRLSGRLVVPVAALRRMLGELS